MSKRILNSTVVLCLLFAAPLFGERFGERFGGESSEKLVVNSMPSTGLAHLKHHDLLSEYKGYPSARRSHLTQSLISRTTRIN